MVELSTLQKVAIWLLPVLFGITVHEVSHGWIAKHLGDPTAMMLGRLTLNPLKHIDPIGTILVPGLLMLMGGVIFGWAKPVPVTFENLRHPRRDAALVALAGPVSNLLMGVLWAVVAKLAAIYQGVLGGFAEPLILMGIAGMFVNTILMVLNLFPVPPLDGGRVLTSLLPPRLGWKLGRIEPYGIIIVLVLLVTGILGRVLWPAIATVLSTLTNVAGLPASVVQFALSSLL